MIGVARDSGNLPAELEDRLHRIADRVDEFLIEPEKPVLIHGDMWKTNVISRAGRVTGIIDPALYYAHNEMEAGLHDLVRRHGERVFSRLQQHGPA